jgi:hypothetical protein
MQVNYLLLNFEQSLLNCWHVSLSHNCFLFLVSNWIDGNLVLDGLQLESVKCLDILLGEILKFAFAGYLYRRLVMFPNYLFIYSTQVSQVLKLFLIIIKLVI